MNILKIDGEMFLTYDEYFYIWWIFLNTINIFLDALKFCEYTLNIFYKKIK